MCSILYILIFIYIIAQYFLSDALSSCFGAIGVECVCVGCVANSFVTCLGMMHLTWTCEMRGSQIVLHILDSLRMVTVVCYLVSVLCIFHSWFRHRNIVVLQHTDIERVIGEPQAYPAEITNERYTRQTPDNTR
jgi:hypothetical protein